MTFPNAMTVMNGIDQEQDTPYVRMVMIDALSVAYYDFKPIRPLFPHCALGHYDNPNLRYLCLECLKGYELNEAYQCSDISLLKNVLYPSSVSNFSYSNATFIQNAILLDSLTNFGGGLDFYYLYIREQSYGYHVHNNGSSTAPYLFRRDLRSFICVPNNFYFVPF